MNVNSLLTSLSKTPVGGLLEDITRLRELEEASILLDQTYQERKQELQSQYDEAAARLTGAIEYFTFRDDNKYPQEYLVRAKSASASESEKPVSTKVINVQSKSSSMALNISQHILKHHNATAVNERKLDPYKRLFYFMVHYVCDFMQPGDVFSRQTMRDWCLANFPNENHKHFPVCFDRLIMLKKLVRSKGKLKPTDLFVTYVRL